jgi:hypothetical protein
MSTEATGAKGTSLMPARSAETEGALLTAAVAAATAAAAYGVKHALAKRGISIPDKDLETADEREQRETAPAIPMLDTVWELASHALLPAAENAAEAAGRWVAANAPPVVRDRLVRRFVRAFDEHAD